MTDDHKIILEKIGTYLEQNPTQRFGQALFNLGINEFRRDQEFQLRDIHSDDDSEIIERIRTRLEWFDLQKKVQIGVASIEGIGGMTVNERLNASGLTGVFDQVKYSNKEHARFILTALKVDEESITQILK